MANLLKAQSTFYNVNAIQKIELQFAQADWDYILDTANLSGGDRYVFAEWVKINGVLIDSVGVKYKGNSSYDSAYKKNPLHIALDEFKDNNYQGYTDIKLSNAYADPSMIREVLSYHILGNYMDCPKANFVQLYINGKHIGVYSNDESINKKFCAAKFGSSGNTFVKCNPTILPTPAIKSNLKYINADSNSYYNYYELKSKKGWNDLVKLCDTISNYATNIENNVDMDRAIWMLAFNNVFVNLDSYSGAFSQNYYLYKDNNNRFLPIVWDLNMSFGAFPFVGNLNTSMGTLSVTNMQQLSPTIHATDAYWPLINAVMNNAVYKRKYVAHMRSILNEFFANNAYVTLANQMQALIDTAVLADSNKFFSYSQFQNGLTTNSVFGTYLVPGISNLMTTRTTYLKSLADFTAIPPNISNVTANTSTPVLNTTISVTATVSNATSSSVSFYYRFSKFKRFTEVKMYDDGLHNDGAASDNVFGVNVSFTSATMQYYIYAENTLAGIFAPERAEHEFYTLSIPNSNVQKGDLVINEFLAKNNKSDINEYGLNEDWIELYNTTDSVLDLTDVFISDDVTSPQQFVLPVGTIIQPKSYLIIWADEFDRTTSRYVHTNFKLSGEGGSVALSNSSLVLLDSVSYGAQTDDISYGRCPNGTGNFTTINIPTFKESNVYCALGVNNSLVENANKIKVFPNPASNHLTILQSKNEGEIVLIYNMMGEKLLEKTFVNNSADIDLDGYSNGAYFYVVKSKNQLTELKGKFIIIK